MAFKVKSPFKSATDALSSALSSTSGAIDKSGSQTASEYKRNKTRYSKQIKEFQQGDAFGKSYYGRYAANVTGVTAMSRAMGRSIDTAENGERPSFMAYRDDAKTMRPTRGGSIAKQQVATDVQVKEQEAANAVNADFERRKRLQAKFDAGQVASRVRRSSRSDRPGTKGGTIKTSGLGSTGGATSFAQLLGL